MVEVSVMRFNMCAVNLFHSLKKCKMIAQKADPERRKFTWEPETRILFIFVFGIKGRKVFFQVNTISEEYDYVYLAKVFNKHMLHEINESIKMHRIVIHMWKVERFCSY